MSNNDGYNALHREREQTRAMIAAHVERLASLRKRDEILSAAMEVLRDPVHPELLADPAFPVPKVETPQEPTPDDRQKVVDREKRADRKAERAKQVRHTWDNEALRNKTWEFAADSIGTGGTFHIDRLLGHLRAAGVIPNGTTKGASVHKVREVLREIASPSPKGGRGENRKWTVL